MLDERAGEVVLGGDVVEAHAGAGDRLLQRLLAGVDLGVETAPELGVAGVGDDLLAGLGVLDDDQPDLRQLALERVDHADGDDLVALREPGQRALPPGVGDEVGDDEHQRTPADRRSAA